MDKTKIDERLAEIQGVMVHDKPAWSRDNLGAIALQARIAGERFFCIRATTLGGRNCEPGDVIDVSKLNDDRFITMAANNIFVPESLYDQRKRYQVRQNIFENILPTPRSQVNQARAAVRAALANVAACEAALTGAKNELTTARSICARHEKELQDLLDSDAIREAFAEV